MTLEQPKHATVVRGPPFPEPVDPPATTPLRRLHPHAANGKPTHGPPPLMPIAEAPPALDLKPAAEHNPAGPHPFLHVAAN